MDDAQIVYKVFREPERRVFYFGHSQEMDAGYFYAPYRPGMTSEEIAEVNERNRYVAPTEFQIKLMQNIKNTPMIRWGKV